MYVQPVLSISIGFVLTGFTGQISKVNSTYRTVEMDVVTCRKMKFSNFVRVVYAESGSSMVILKRC